MVSLQCPLGRTAFLTLEKPMGLQHLTEIEEHVAARSSDCPHSPLKDLSFDDDSMKGTTPLLMACYYGELASVKRIVECWGVDVNLAATYHFHRPFYNHSKIKKASPLFVAASACYLDIVRYLVGKGAVVSAKTSDETDSFFNGLSPLYGAFLIERIRRPREQSPAERLEERASIVRVLLEFGAVPSADALYPKDGRPMWMSDLCGIAAIMALIDHGLEVNHRTPGGCITLLNYWIRRACIEEKSVAVVQLLLDHGADVNIPDSRGFTPIIRAVYYQKWALLDLFLERTDISRNEKIDALELAGAIILEKTDGESSSLFPKALECWRRSIHLRLDDSDGRGPITKVVPLYQETGRVVEWVTLEELERVIQSCEFKVQSFLVRSRIVSAISWDAFTSLLFGDFGSCWTIVDKSIALVKQKRFGDLLGILWSLLETMQRFHLQEERLRSKTLEVFNCLFVTLKHLHTNDDLLLNAATIKTSLELVLASDRFHF